jgi:hypothetical protein
MIKDAELSVLLKAIARVTRAFFDQQSAPITGRLAELERSVRELEREIEELRASRRS